MLLRWTTKGAVVSCEAIRQEDGQQTLPALLQAIRAGYAKGETAYWLSPIVATLRGRPHGRIAAGDAVIFCCRRGEREIQLTEAFTDPRFDAFSRDLLVPLTFVQLVRYHPRFSHLSTAFPTQIVDQPLGEVVAASGRRQWRAAETEKLSHVTYFFNGRRADPFPGEARFSVPSYPSDPARALPALVSGLQRALADDARDLVVLNLATGDLLGHSDSLDVKIECADAIDRSLTSILDLARQHGYWTAITADHGLLEDHGPAGGPVNTSHTTHPVPFVLLPPHGKNQMLRRTGTLADVAPTLLSLLGLKIPSAMSGTPLTNATDRAERVMLIILDGWGLGDSAHVNPIDRASVPCWRRLLEEPIASLQASGDAVGLLPGTKGNSESGHLTIGAGRPVQQDDTRIAAAIADGSFRQIDAFQDAFSAAAARQRPLHLIGILSRTSSHGSIDYVLELAAAAHERGLEDVYVHLITDGRSSRSERLPADLEEADAALRTIGVGSIVSLFGRGLALDRGRRYREKTQPVYEALTRGTGTRAEIELAA